MSFSSEIQAASSQKRVANSSEAEAMASDGQIESTSFGLASTMSNDRTLSKSPDTKARAIPKKHTLLLGESPDRSIRALPHSVRR